MIDKTTVRLPLSEEVELKLRLYQQLIREDILYWEFPKENDLFGEPDSDKREPYGLEKKLRVDIVRNLPRKANFSKIVNVLKNYQSINYTISGVGVSPFATEGVKDKFLVYAKISSLDAEVISERLREAFNLSYSSLFNHAIPIAYVTDKDLLPDPRGIETDTSATGVQVAFPSEIITYSLIGNNHWMVEE